LSLTRREHTPIVSAQALVCSVFRVVLQEYQGGSNPWIARRVGSVALAGY